MFNQKNGESSKIDNPIKIIDDRSDHTFGLTMNEDFKKQITVNVTKAPFEDVYDQVKFKES